MVLAAEVTDRRGRLLIPAGEALSAKHLHALKMWGVAHVEIEGKGPAEPAASPVDEATLRRATEDVRELFSNCGLTHPLLAELHRISLERRAREMASHAGTGS